MKRVVVTGIGIISCLGNNQKEVCDSLMNTKSGISFEEEYKEGMTVKQAIGLGVKALKKANEEKFDIKNVEIADVSKEMGFRNLSPEEIKKQSSGKN